MGITRSSRLFQERLGLRLTYRSPVPTVTPTRHPLFTKRLTAPLPLVAALSSGDPPPDRGLTKEPWPHGTEC